MTYHVDLEIVFKFIRSIFFFRLFAFDKYIFILGRSQTPEYCRVTIP